MAAANSLLTAHHGTRGASLAAMAIDRNEPWVLVGRNGKKMPMPGPKHWVCRICTSEQPADGMPWCVPGHQDTCNRCVSNKRSGTRHPKAVLFGSTKMGKASVAAAAVSGPKAGPAGGKADTEQERVLKRQLAAANKSLADANKKLAASPKKQPTKTSEPEEEEEFQDAVEGDEDTEGGDSKSWQVDLDELKQDNKDLRKKITSSKSARLCKEWEATIVLQTAKMEELQNNLWNAQDPQLQLQKKAEKSQRLLLKQPKIEEKIKQASTLQQEAQAEADKHESLVAELYAEYKTNAAEIERLNAEAHQVSTRLSGFKEADLGEAVAKALEGKLKIFDDPIFASDPSVAQRKEAIQTHACTVQTMLTAFTDSINKLQEFAVEVREKCVAESKQKAEDAAKQAVEAAKVAKQTAEAADAAKKQSQEETSKQTAADTSPLAATPAAVPVEPGSAPASGPKERTNGSRSPPPKTRFAAGSSSALAASTTRTKLVEAAVAKRAGDRTPEENLLAASAAKTAKKGSWADTTEEADMADDSQ